MVEVGQKFELKMGPITREQILEYANASGDRNPIHIDEKFATERGGLNGVIAHGMLSFGFINRLVSDIAGNGKVLKIGCEMRGMVRPGDDVVSVATVKEVNGKHVKLEIIQNSVMPLKIEKNGQIIKTYEGWDRKWPKEGEPISTKETPEGTLYYREALSIKATAEIELA